MSWQKHFQPPRSLASESEYRIFKQKELLEDALLVYKLVRNPYGVDYYDYRRFV